MSKNNWLSFVAAQSQSQSLFQLLSDFLCNHPPTYLSIYLHTLLSDWLISLVVILSAQTDNRNSKSCRNSLLKFSLSWTVMQLTFPKSEPCGEREGEKPRGMLQPLAEKAWRQANYKINTQTGHKSKQVHETNVSIPFERLIKWNKRMNEERREWGRRWNTQLKETCMNIMQNIFNIS